MAFWERSVANVLHAVRLNSVKSRVLVFALLATVIPSLTTVRVSYVHNRESLFDKVTTELNSVSSHGARENDLWLKERFYDVRVFSNSPEVWENIQTIQRARARNVSDSDSLDRLETYLAAVRDRFDDYAALTVLDSEAEVLARTGSLSRLKLPDDWLSRVAIGEELRGDAYWDDAQARYVLDIARPIRGPQGTFLGVMAAQVNFHSVGESLRAANIGPTGHVYLMGHDGRLLISSRVQQVNIVDKALPATTVESLNEVASLEYAGARGLWVIGTLDKVPLSDWVVVAEIETAEAFEPIIELRNQTIIVLVGLLLTVGLLAYLFSLIIVRPLGRLNAAAAEVAAGNLNVEVPVVSHDELGYLTRIFNDMVTQIRQSRDKLEKLSITDGLTGLFNRSHMMETLKAEVARCKRGEMSFAVLMLDIDNFKDYNDAFGHLAGDEVLNKMGVILRESSREMDYVARYGGEEFLVLLPDSTLDGCVEVAERIRERLGQERYSTGPETRVSISIGAAEFPRHGDSAEAIIKAADAALYEAKRAGRDRVVEASPDNVVPDDEMPLESPASA